MKSNPGPIRAMLGAIVLLTAFGLASVHLPARGAGTQMFAGANTPVLDAAGGKNVGTLAPGAAVSVSGQSGSSTHVTVSGFAAAGSPATLFTSADKHIVVLSKFTGHAVPGATQSVAGTTYTAVTADGWVATNALVADVATVWKSASDMYAQKCGSCHSLRPANSYSANQWPAIMKTQADNAGLDPGQTALITTYLQVQSGK